MKKEGFPAECIPIRFRPLPDNGKQEWKKPEEEREETPFKKNWKDQKKQKGLIALAHNKNDLAETMIHHLCRGTGLRGLSPMEARKDGVIRPVLCLERKEIDNYLKERKISFCRGQYQF